MRRPPGRPKSLPTRILPAPKPAPFDVGGHEVLLWLEEGRWCASVDGERLPRWFTTQVDAWAAGVAQADGLRRAG